MPSLWVRLPWMSVLWEKNLSLPSTPAPDLLLHFSILAICLSKVIKREFHICYFEISKTQKRREFGSWYNNVFSSSVINSILVSSSQQHPLPSLHPRSMCCRVLEPQREHGRHNPVSWPATGRVLPAGEAWLAAPMTWSRPALLSWFHSRVPLCSSMMSASS